MLRGLDCCYAPFVCGVCPGIMSCDHNKETMRTFLVIAGLIDVNSLIAVDNV